MKEIKFYTPQNDNFEKSYLKVREKEGFLYSDEMVKLLPKLPKTHPHFIVWKQRKQNADAFCKYITDKKIDNILEIGCGNGWFSHLIAKNNKAKILGFDINLKELEQGNRVFERTNLNFGYGNIFETTFDKKFDIIVMNASVQYFEDISELLKVLKKNLTKNGELHFLDTHFYESKALADEAKQRTVNYYESINSIEMVSNYFHPCREDIVDFEMISSPVKFNFLRRKKSPFNWYRYTVVTSK